MHESVFILIECVLAFEAGEHICCFVSLPRLTSTFKANKPQVKKLRSNQQKRQEERKARIQQRRTRQMNRRRTSRGESSGHRPAATSGRKAVQLSARPRFPEVGVRTDLPVVKESQCLYAHAGDGGLRGKTGRDPTVGQTPGPLPRLAGTDLQRGSRRAHLPDPSPPSVHLRKKQPRARERMAARRHARRAQDRAKCPSLGAETPREAARPVRRTWGRMLPGRPLTFCQARTNPTQPEGMDKNGAPRLPLSFPLSIWWKV